MVSSAISLTRRPSSLEKGVASSTKKSVNKLKKARTSNSDSTQESDKFTWRKSKQSSSLPPTQNKIPKTTKKLVKKSLKQNGNSSLLESPVRPDPEFNALSPNNASQSQQEAPRIPPKSKKRKLPSHTDSPKQPVKKLQKTRKLDPGNTNRPDKFRWFQKNKAQPAKRSSEETEKPRVKIHTRPSTADLNINPNIRMPLSTEAPWVAVHPNTYRQPQNNDLMGQQETPMLSPNSKNQELPSSIDSSKEHVNKLQKSQIRKPNTGKWFDKLMWFKKPKTDLRTRAPEDPDNIEIEIYTRQSTPPKTNTKNLTTLSAGTKTLPLRPQTGNSLLNKEFQVAPLSATVKPPQNTDLNSQQEAPRLLPKSPKRQLSKSLELSQGELSLAQNTDLNSQQKARILPPKSEKRQLFDSLDLSKTTEHRIIAPSSRTFTSSSTITTSSTTSSRSLASTNTSLSGSTTKINGTTYGKLGWRSNESLQPVSEKQPFQENSACKNSFNIVFEPLEKQLLDANIRLEAELSLSNRDFKTSGVTNKERAKVVAFQMTKVQNLQKQIELQAWLSAQKAKPTNVYISKGKVFGFYLDPTLNLVDNLYNLEQTLKGQLIMNTGEQKASYLKPSEPTKAKKIKREKENLEKLLRELYRPDPANNNPFGKPLRSDTTQSCPPPSTSKIKPLSQARRSQSLPLPSNQNQLWDINEDTQNGVDYF